MAALCTLRRLNRIHCLAHESTIKSRIPATAQRFLLQSRQSQGNATFRAFHRSALLSQGQAEVSYNFNIQDEEDFQDRVIKAKTPMVVDFHADWCGPCKFLGPKLEKAVDEQEGKVLLAKVDIDELSDIAMQYEVKVVPTVVGIKNGEKIAKFEGNIPDDEIEAFIKKLLQR